ncbi:hypothetical protein L7F22_048596 [Adiantum nelumboides]|nr:hypothetical protein [Adiantum nelumboides]
MVMESSSSKSIFLTWKDLIVKIPAGGGRNHGQPCYLLQNVSGYAEPGSLLAIMGLFGCGKTTLLNALAVNCYTLQWCLNELVHSYVTQDDSLIATLTTYETLVYSVQLQLPDIMTSFEKQQRVQNTIREMGLQDCADTPVGGWYIRGLSGGQKRHLSIAIETLKQRPLLFLDEPTSGLDSAAAFHVVKRLRMLAKAGRTLLISIHQPGSEVFGLFDFLCLLSSGQTVYFGERMKAQELFDDAGFSCPPYRNPYDHFLWVISSDFEETKDEELGSEATTTSHKVQILIRSYADSDINKAVAMTIQQASQKYMTHIMCFNCCQEGELIRKGDVGKASALKQTFYLTSRSFTNMRRDIAYYWFRLFVYTILAICVGTIYYNVGHSFDAIQARAGLFIFVTGFLTFMGVASFPSFIEDIKIFTRERLNGHYGVAVFVIANFLSAFPFVLLLAIIPGVILYTMIGLHPDFDHFICFIVTLLATLSVEEGLLIAIASVAPDFLTGMIAGCGIMGMYLLNGRFFQLLRNLPKPVWRYPLSYMSFHTWASKAFYNNDFQGLVFENNVMGCPPLTGRRYSRPGLICTWNTRNGGLSLC